MRFLVFLLALVFVTAAQANDRTAETNYVLRCVGCHDTDGTGLPAAGIPNFVDEVGVFAGLHEGRAYLLHVPGVIGSSLSDSETADVLNYIMTKWAGPSLPSDYVPFTSEEVQTLKTEGVGNPVKYRRVVAAKLAQSGIEVPDYPWP